MLSITKPDFFDSQQYTCFNANLSKKAGGGSFVQIGAATMTQPTDCQISELQSELNQQKQAYAALEMELQKQESGKRNQENDTANDSKYLALEKELDTLKAKHKEDTDRINSLAEQHSTFEKLLSEYVKAFNQALNEVETITVENDTTKRHLANLESAFSDVHQKYERAKQIIEGFRTNEEMLQHSLINSTETVKKSGEKYDSLKAHAKAQIERSNKELLGYRDKHQTEVIKLSTIIKRLEIKNASFEKALDQKTTECAELAALCNEVTGRID